MTYQHQAFPAWRYGPDGQSCLVDSDEETPKGFVDHPSKVKGAPDQSDSGTKTARQPAGTTATAADAAKTRTAKSQTAVDPAVAAKSGAPGLAAPGSSAAAAGEVDADGHAYDPALHAGTGSKTKAGLWRMKVGVARPAPVKPPLDL